MTNVRTVSLVGLAGLLLIASACGNEVVKKVEEIADRACACTDAACAKAVHQDYMKYFADNSEKKGSESDKNKVSVASERMKKCIMEKTNGAPLAPAVTATPVPGAGAAAAPGGATPPEVAPPSGGATPPPPAGGATGAGAEAPAEGKAPAEGAQ